jgi:hypothetical protein
MISSAAIANGISIAAVAINTVYVVLTYRMLTYMRRDSLREHRLRHLDDLKAQVIQPLWVWIDSSAIPSLDGRQNLINMTSTAIPREGAPLGDLSVSFKRHLVGGCPPPIQAQSALFTHAKEIHFKAEMRAFEDFERRRRGYLVEIVALARQCADSIAAMTQLPRRGSFEGGTNFIDSDLFVAASFKDLVGGNIPQITQYPGPGNDGLITLQHGNGTLAIGEPTEIRRWWEQANVAVKSSWDNSEATAQAHQLLVEANRVKEALISLEHTYDLPRDCEYVGGPRENSQRRA